MIELVLPGGDILVFFAQATFGWVRKPWATDYIKWRNQWGRGLDFGFTSPFLALSFSVERLQKVAKAD